jgi:four helix bundle protein
MAGIRRVEDIEAYQLAVALRRRVLGIVASGRIRNDWKFIDQIRDSVRGASRNISEGFSRFAPGEFSQFLSYAKASLDETRNHIEDGFESGYFTAEERDELLALLGRTIGAIRGFMRYLASPAAKRWYAQRRRTTSAEPEEP